MLSARALFFEPSQSCKAPGLSCPIRVTIAIATPPLGLNSLGMPFDNPSRGANPWTTLKRTAKTKSLRFVRLCQSVSAQQKDSVTCPNGQEIDAILVNSKNSLRIDQNPAKLARHPVCLMPPRQRSLSQYPKG